MQWAMYKGNVPCVLNQEFLFFGSQVLGFKATRLGWSIGSYETCSTRKPCAKTVPEMDSLMQQKQYHKRTTLRTMKIPLQSIHSEEGLHYCLSKAQESFHLTSNKCHIWHGYIEDPTAKHSYRGKPTLLPRSKARGSCHMTSDNQPIHKFGYPWWFHTRAVLSSLANARKCQSKDFFEKERYESCSVQLTFKAETFGKKAEKGKFTGSEATTRFPRASCFEKPTHSIPETWGRMYNVLARRN